MRPSLDEAGRRQRRRAGGQRGCRWGGAAAPAAAPTAAEARPILGQWTLVDTDKAAYCPQSSQTFTADSGTSVRDGKTSTGHLIYDVKPTFVYVSYGGPNTEQWDVVRAG